MALKKQTLVFKDIYHDTLTVGSDFTIPDLSGTAMPQTYLDRIGMDINSNFRIRNAGLFCNFADGLVPKGPCEHTLFYLYIAGYTRGDEQAGTITINTKSKSIVGAGTSFTSLSAGEMIYTLNPANSQVSIYRIDSITDDTHMDIIECPFDGGANIAFYDMSVVSGRATSTYQLPATFNYMFDYSEFLPVTFFAGTTPDYIVMYPNFQFPDSMIYHTDSISADFDGETCFFDFVAEIEYTD